jgi:hypothetical protein
LRLEDPAKGVREDDREDVLALKYCEREQAMKKNEAKAEREQ